MSPSAMLRHLAIFRRMYEWTEQWAERPSAGWALFALSWVDNIFFPVPSEVLQLALFTTRPKRSLRYAAIVVAGTLAGAASGYLLGYALDPVALWLLDALGSDGLESVRAWMAENQSWATFVGSLSPFSDKLLVLGSGVLELPLGSFVLFYTLGRAARTYPTATLFYLAGPRMKPWIERHIEVLSAVFTLAVTALVVAVVLLSG